MARQSSSPVRGSHTRMPPLWAVATRSSVGMEGHGAHPARAVAEADLGVGRGGRPELDGAVHAARGGLRSIGAEGHAVDEPHVAVEGGQRSPRGHVPEPQAPVLTARDELLAVGPEREAADEAAMPQQGAFQLAGLDGPRGGSTWSHPPEAIHWPSGLKVTA